MFGKRAVPVAGLIVAMAVVCALLLALPGRTVTTVYVNDLFIFLDGAHRIATGQVPNRDFHTALGPLTFYLPAIGYWMSGSLGAAMPLGMALLVVGLAPTIAHVLSSRLRPIIALPFAAFVILILAVPMNLGESIASLSFAMFYNRVGWAALAVLFVMYLRPERPRLGQEILDALCAACLVLVMLYTKATYGVVALAFLAFPLLEAGQRRWAALAIGLVLLAVLGIEGFWRASSAHVADLRLASQVSGLRAPEEFLEGFLRHLADTVMLAIFVALALRQTRSFRDVLFFGFCAGPGLLVMAQNAQPWGIITLQAGAAVAAEMLMRSAAAAQGTRPDLAEADSGSKPALALGAPLLLLALILPTTVHCFTALGLHAALAATRAGERLPMPNLEGVRLAELWSPGDHPFSTEYLASLKDGARALADLGGAKPSRVSVLDFVNPFSAGLGLAPPRGDSAWLHWGRNVSEAGFVPAEELLGDVELLMVPKGGINSGPRIDLYGPSIKQAFDVVRETDAWTVYRRRAEPPWNTRLSWGESP